MVEEHRKLMDLITTAKATGKLLHFETDNRGRVLSYSLSSENSPVVKEDGDLRCQSELKAYKEIFTHFASNIDQSSIQKRLNDFNKEEQRSDISKAVSR